MELRPLGRTGIRVSPIALGGWPISGMTTFDVTEANSLATISACFELGVNFLDTAYAYGAGGESERLIARAIRGRRDEMVIATKGGIAWAPGGARIIDAQPATLIGQCEESLRRLETDRVELLYLHAPDPQTPLEDSAVALRGLLEAGKTRAVGLSNATPEQIEQFAAVCPLSAYQPPYNMLQRQIEAEIVPWCQAHDVALCTYWPLMKGLLAGKIERGHTFDPRDGRVKYPMFQGAEWERNQAFVDCLRRIAAEAGRSVAQVVLNWTIHQPGITSALCGAKRPDQIRENAGAAGWRLTAAQLAQIEAAIQARGAAVTRGAV
jgi:aryl-alcohol dehydrogenase-like predicted oxidoreductase